MPASVQTCFSEVTPVETRKIKASQLGNQDFSSQQKNPKVDFPAASFPSQLARLGFTFYPVSGSSSKVYLEALSLSISHYIRPTSAKKFCREKASIPSHHFTLTLCQLVVLSLLFIAGHLCKYFSHSSQKKW